MKQMNNINTFVNPFKILNLSSIFSRVNHFVLGTIAEKLTMEIPIAVPITIPKLRKRGNAV